jgi:hypothetical protein
VASPGFGGWEGQTWRARSASLYGGLGVKPSVGSWGKAPGEGVQGDEAALKLRALAGF